MARVAVVIEGERDGWAVLAVAETRGIDLHTTGITIVALGGSTDVARYIAETGPAGDEVLLDAGHLMSNVLW